MINFYKLVYFLFERKSLTKLILFFCLYITKIAPPTIMSDIKIKKCRLIINAQLNRFDYSVYPHPLELVPQDKVRNEQLQCLLVH